MEAMQKSNLLLAKILDMAMQNGIKHWQLSFEDINLTEDYAEHFYPCVEWLEAEGLIRVGEYARTMGGIADGSIFDISLTSHGLGILGQSIDVNGGTESLSEAVKKVSEGRVDYHRVMDAIGGLLGGIVKSVSS